MSFLYHEQCPSCGSKNNLARYADGHAFCFGCMYRERSTDAFVPSESYVPATENSFKLIEGEAVPLTQRGICVTETPARTRRFPGTPQASAPRFVRGRADPFFFAVISGAVSEGGGLGSGFRSRRICFRPSLGSLSRWR